MLLNPEEKVQAELSHHWQAE